MSPHKSPGSSQSCLSFGIEDFCIYAKRKPPVLSVPGKALLCDEETTLFKKIYVPLSVILDYLLSSIQSAVSFPPARGHIVAEALS